MPLEYIVDNYVSEYLEGRIDYVTEDQGDFYIAEPGTPVIPADDWVYYVLQFADWQQFQLDLVMPFYHPTELLLYLTPTPALLGRPPTGPLDRVQMLVMRQGPFVNAPYYTEDLAFAYVTEPSNPDYVTEDESSTYTTEDESAYDVETFVPEPQVMYISSEIPLFWDTRLILVFDLAQNPNVLMSQFTRAQLRALAMTFSNFGGFLQPGVLTVAAGPVDFSSADFGPDFAIGLP